ncbi:hypothetical protein L5849_08085 [Erythrobacter sp. SN021]|jgi:hypothetical protein|uniref:hypothetical protein n=1 Tax=Erythrobacter sp. SN021 TaxID=2912574 RepID=UPI001F404177|nr:hypothetical protein [Erythrobacter sp. SN021]MCF8882655.1 hypothetical protein [Erythrobacter sp. SN021]
MQWIRRFFTDLAGSYIDSLRAIRALPWLFAAIILWEFAQHVVEVRIGMFADEETARAVSQDGTRMAFGWVKMISIYIGAFFVIRHFAGTRDGRQLAPLGIAAKRFAPYLVYSLVLFAAVFYTRSFVAEENVFTVRAVVGLGQVLIEPLLMAWIVASATDGRIAGPIGSAKCTGLLYFLALPLFLLARTPVSLLHQHLNEWAMGKQGAALWTPLAIDSVVVGLIVAITPAAMVRVARWVELHREGKPDQAPGERASA